jgi:hypothetical protein
VALLHATDLLKHGYVSLAPSDDKRDWFSVVGRNKVMMETCPKAVELLKNIEEELITTFPPLYLDTEDLMTNQAKLSNNTNYLYMQSYFSVVTETFFFQKERPDEYGRFFSEKTFKPVAMRHPFIIASVPNFFDKFKELGYKSFHPWINEEYDKEGDDAIRMWKIIKEIERLCNLTPSELEIWLQEMKKICVHNYDVMMSKSQDTDYFTDL